MKDLLIKITSAKMMASDIGRTAKIPPKEHEKILEVYGCLVLAEKRLMKLVEVGNDGN